MHWLLFSYINIILKNKSIKKFSFLLYIRMNNSYELNSSLTSTILSIFAANSVEIKLPVTISIGTPFVPIKYDEGIIITGSESVEKNTIEKTIYGSQFTLKNWRIAL